jgi:TRAP-type uncharacterized transport system substrate-binding protein
MILLTLAIFVLLTSLAFQRSKVRYLTLAAGSPSGESYIVCTALSTVLERHYPTIKLRVLETGGTVESLKMIEDGQVQLAVAQADVLAGPSARILAVLYDDTFQLLTPRLSPVRSFAALRGKTIALPPSGGQLQSFLRVARHFGLQFYEKGKPSFILAHADYLGLMLTVLVMVSSWIWELRAWIQAKQKNISDEYSNQVVALINAAREAQSPAALEEIRGRLLGILTAAVSDLDADRLSEESFHSFRAILQIGLEVVRDSAATFRTREVAF